MLADYTVTAVKDGGLVDNPKGPGQLQRQYVSVKGPDGTETADVYLRRKPENAASVGSVVFGELKKSEQGWRLFPERKQPSGGGGGNQAKDEYWQRKEERDVESQRRMGRAHAQGMAVEAAVGAGYFKGEITREKLDGDLLPLIDWFDNDVLGADVGSGQAAHGASDNHPPVAEDAADLSADVGTVGSTAVVPTPSNDASPAQKAKLTKLFHAAGLSREAMKAVVLFRCGAEKATKQGAESLIRDLQEGATHDALLAEIWDAKRAGNPLGARAAALIPSEVPWDGEGLPPAKVAE